MSRAGSSPAIGTLKWPSQRENPAIDLKFGWRTVTQKNAEKRNLFAKFVASASRARDSCDETTKAVENNRDRIPLAPRGD